MLTREKAQEVVGQKLRELSPPDDIFIIVDAGTIEKPYGWIFFYNSKKYLDTGEIRHALAGNGPVIVNRLTEAVDFYGASGSIQDLIEEYERKLPG